MKKEMNEKIPLSLKSFTADIMKGDEPIIQKLEHRYKLPWGYLGIAIALHFPFLEKNWADLNMPMKTDKDFYKFCDTLALYIKDRIDLLPSEFRKMVYLNGKKSKVAFSGEKILETYEKELKSEIHFSNVHPDTGMLIQKNLHYIRCGREDTKFHFGLFRGQEKYPYAYVAFSVLDRKYLEMHIPFSTKREQVLVLTRSYNINTAPQNSMSMLLGLCAQYFRERLDELDYVAIVTAVNPNLFKGTVFKAARFFPFAKTQFDPLYYNGRYVTRKYCKNKFGSENLGFIKNNSLLSRKKINCGSIIWMGRGITKNATDAFERNKKIIFISEKEYWKG